MKFKPTPDGVMMGDIKSEEEEREKELKEYDKKGTMIEGIPFPIAILTKSSDKQGHKGQIRFSIPDRVSGHAISLMKYYPQAKTPPDMYRACFYAGVRLLDYVARNEVDKELIYFRNLCRDMETEEKDLDKIVYTSDHIKILRDRYKNGIINFKEYKNRRKKLLDALQPAIETAVGKSAIKVLTDKLEKDDEETHTKNTFDNGNDWP